MNGYDQLYSDGREADVLILVIRRTGTATCSDFIVVGYDRCVGVRRRYGQLVRFVFSVLRSRFGIVGLGVATATRDDDEDENVSSNGFTC